RGEMRGFVRIGGLTVHEVPELGDTLSELTQDEIRTVLSKNTVVLQRRHAGFARAILVSEDKFAERREVVRFRKPVRVVGAGKNRLRDAVDEAEVLAYRAVGGQLQCQLQRDLRHSALPKRRRLIDGGTQIVGHVKYHQEQIDWRVVWSPAPPVGAVRPDVPENPRSIGGSSDAFNKWLREARQHGGDFGDAGIEPCVDVDELC